MSRRGGRIRDTIVNTLLGIDLRVTTGAFHEYLQFAAAERATMESWRHTAEADLAYLRRRVMAQTEVLRRQLDDIDGLRSRLHDIRRTEQYAASITETEPLVSVRIGSYRKTDELVDIAIASILRQSYQNFEIIVVNDGPNAKTRRALEGINDPRIRYYELEQRGAYPDDPRSRWMVAGIPGANRGADLARGTWIAPLDDDDEFSDDHIEKLIALAQGEGVELAYGALVQKNLVNGDERRIWSSPPAISEFSFQGAIYLRALNDVFRYRMDAWLLDEPGDWNLIRRMVEAGVTMAATPDTVATMRMIPYTHKLDDSTPGAGAGE